MSFFGGPQLNNSDIIVFMYILFLFREDENKCWMNCTLNIDLDVIHHQDPITYKYIYLSKTNTYLYEYLHGPTKKFGHVFIDRCLIVPPQYCKPKGKTFQKIV